jgi:hypothetical protein
MMGNGAGFQHLALPPDSLEQAMTGIIIVIVVLLILAFLWRLGGVVLDW